MKKYYYYVFVICVNGKYWATNEIVSECYNLYAYIQKYDNLVCVHQCETIKKSKELAEFWNKCYKNNGTNLY